MIQRLSATFHDGKFSPDADVDLPDGAKVTLVVESVNLIPPVVTDPVELERRMKALLENMKNNPLPLSAPRFTREELHERR
jgi:hypothetical protein